MNNEIKVKDIINITKGKLLYGNEDSICENFTRDTREIKQNDIFIGIKGENHDGGILYKDALEKGAKGCIINKGIILNIEKVNNKFIIEVEDSILAIQQIAKMKREKYDIPVVAITGSVGKTSTKDIVASVLSEKYDVLKTQGNMNNHIGLPLTILGLKNHTAMVVEMGMNHLGEIEKLSKIAEPTIAIITNIGTAHIGNLGSRENILKAKLEILSGMKENGKVVINNDNDILHKWYLENKGKYNIISYGINNKSMEMAINIKYEEYSSEYILNNENNIIVPIGGEAFVYNSLAAICVGKTLNIELNDIKSGIKKFKLSRMRLDVVKSSKGYTIINDCYNANYDSMKSAINFLAHTNGKRKIAVLGDMLELGKYSKELHKKVGKIICDEKVDILITVGKESKEIAKKAEENGLETYQFNTNAEAIEKLKSILNLNDIVLIKASNSMKFSEIVNAII